MVKGRTGIKELKKKSLLVAGEEMEEGAWRVHLGYIEFKAGMIAPHLMKLKLGTYHL